MAAQGIVLQDLFHLTADATFSLYTSEEVEKISVVLVNNPQPRTPLKTYEYNGYLDPRMGVIEPYKHCETCHCIMKDCQGHVGHIQLVDVVYNPLTFSLASRLLARTCKKCHHFCITEHVLRKFTAKFACIRAGMVVEAEDADALDDVQLLALTSTAAAEIAEKGEVSQSLILGELHTNALKQMFATTKKACPRCSSIIPRVFTENGVKCFREEILASNLKEAEEAEAIEIDNLGQQEDFEFLTPKFVCAELMELEKNNAELFRYAFGYNFKIESLFIKNLIVTPNRHRMPRFLNGQQFDSPISILLGNILELNMDLLENKANVGGLEGLVDLQYLVNEYIDATKSKHPAAEGLREKLEKKSGLFRSNIQGKRVNFAARSVISPDINLSTCEVGIPDRFAKVLTFPEPVSSMNLSYLEELVKNGPKYPGANYVETPSGEILSLATMTNRERAVHAELLAEEEPGKTWFVHRHIMPGDPMIFNRQPTLHRLSMMVHRVRILPGQSKTIRFHYVNCDGYNADFDGDEMNLHMPQTYPQVSEATELALNDLNYISIFDGGTRRGLIQDSVLGGVLLTQLGNFVYPEDFEQLCWMGCAQMCREEARMAQERKFALLNNIDRVQGSNPFSASNDTKFVGALSRGHSKNIFRSNGDGYKYVADNITQQYAGNKHSAKLKSIVVVDEQPEIDIPQPAILFPQAVYTGKQVVGVMLDRVCGTSKINIKHMNSLPADTWGVHGASESMTTVVNNELLTGLVDKLHISAKKNGLAHAVYELCGGVAAGEFLTGYGRLAEFILESRGCTCSLEDMVLSAPAEAERNAIYGRMGEVGVDTANSFLESSTSDITALKAGLRYQLQQDPKSGAKFDSDMEGAAEEITTELAKACAPNQLLSKLPQNSLALMIETGAKGSSVNMQMMTTCLGEESLEGRRVPTTIVGRTLPCYRPFDNIDFIPGGYVFDRFLTGIRPQSFFFHHEAGREGLIDTAVKTATSGYFERCIIKSAEGISVCYDGTVRDADGSLVECLYGGDGLDPCKTPMLANFDFLARNSETYMKQLNSFSEKTKGGVEYLEKLTELFAETSVEDFLQRPYEFEKSLKKIAKYYNRITGRVLSEELLIREAYELVHRESLEPITLILSPYTHLGSVKPSYRQAIENYFERTTLLAGTGGVRVNNFELSKQQMLAVALTKYRTSLIAPGEAVGVIAGESIGEPSTQLTLNTFHLAGHGAANVTLGIPRLREIVMQASKQILTPLISVRCESEEEAATMCQQLQKLYFREMVQHLSAEEELSGTHRQFYVSFKLYDLADFPGLTASQFEHAVCNILTTQIVKAINKEIKQQSDQQVEQGEEEIITRVRLAGDGVDNDAATDNGGNGEHEEDSHTSVSVSATDDENASDKEGPQAKVEEEAEENADENDEIQTEPSVTANHNIPYEFCCEDGSWAVLANSVKFVTTHHISFTGGVIRMRFEIDIEHQILLMNLLESVIDKVVIRETRGVENTFMRKVKEAYMVDIEGNNLRAMFMLPPDYFYFPELKCNDINAIHERFGVEAARAAIIEEIQNVFDVYHINTDYHHLALVADFMTQNGGFRPLNRIGIAPTPHVLLKSSFETSSAFVVDAAINGRIDQMNTASSKITVGQQVPIGTGCFDLQEVL